MAIEGIDRLNSAAPLGAASEAGSVRRTAAASAQMPDAVSSILESISLPQLPPTSSGMDLENILKAIGNETRRNAVKSSVNDIETKGNEQKEINEKELNEIKKRLEDMRKKSVLSGFLKAFKIIGLIVGAIASVATTVAGAVTANPLLITAGVVGLGMTLDSTLSLATDGKVSLQAGFTALGKACGMSDETAQWFGIGMNAAVMVAGIAVTCGAAFASSSAKAVTEAGSTVAKITASIGKVTNVVSGVNSVAEGGVTIGDAVVSNDISKSQARSKQLQAALEKVRQAIQFYEDIIKAEMERAEQLMDNVEDIVENCSDTQKNILTANPAMA